MVRVRDITPIIRKIISMVDDPLEHDVRSLELCSWHAQNRVSSNCHESDGFLWVRGT